MVGHPVVARACAWLAGLLILLLPVLLLGGAAAAVPVAAQAPRAPAGAAPDRAPLLISIDALTPAYVPARGPIRITGEVRNRDSVAWTTINLYPILGEDPIRTGTGLAEAAQTPPDAYVGDRMTDVEDSVALLAPGESTTFTLTVPRNLVLDRISPGVPGVYWFGVHAIGTSETSPRDDFADGRARTFLPFVPPSVDRRVKTALMVPLRHRLTHDADGSLSDVDGWERTLTAGRLRDMVEFADSAGTTPLTWLVDPAVPDAVRRIALGNPPRSLAPTDEAPEGDPSASASPSETAETEDGGDDAEEDAEEDAEDAEDEPDEPTPSMTAAQAWLADLEEALRGQELLTLPYSDLDLAAAAEHDPAMIELARAQVGAVLEEWGLEGSPVAGAPNGFIDAATVQTLDPEIPVLVTDAAFAEDPPGVAALDGHTVVVTSAGAADGGPAPGDRTDPIPLRQRILSEAALRVLEPADREPLVVSLPSHLPGAGADEFFEGMDAGWIELTTVADAAERAPRPVGPDDLGYPERQQRLELDADTFEDANRLIRAGETLQNLLTRNSQVAAEITDQALTALSYGARRSPSVSRASLSASYDRVQDRLRSVTISAPPGVTLSSADGEFVATVSNKLDQPVTVAVEARTGEDLAVTAPETVELAPTSRTSVLLDARVTSTAVQNVTLVLTDTEGAPLGSSDRLPIRSAQVSDVIWVIIGFGGLVLFGAIGLRLLRRARRIRRGDPADGEPAPAEEHAAAEPGP